MSFETDALPPSEYSPSSAPKRPFVGRSLERSNLTQPPANVNFARVGTSSPGQPPPVKKPGFFRRLFGSTKKAPQGLAEKEAPAASPPAVPLRRRSTLAAALTMQRERVGVGDLSGEFSQQSSIPVEQTEIEPSPSMTAEMRYRPSSATQETPLLPSNSTAASHSSSQLRRSSSVKPSDNSLAEISSFSSKQQQRPLNAEDSLVRLDESSPAPSPFPTSVPAFSLSRQKLSTHSAQSSHDLLPSRVSQVSPPLLLPSVGPVKEVAAQWETSALKQTESSLDRRLRELGLREQAATARLEKMKEALEETARQSSTTIKACLAKLRQSVVGRSSGENAATRNEEGAHLDLSTSAELKPVLNQLEGTKFGLDHLVFALDSQETHAQELKTEVTDLREQLRKALTELTEKEEEITLREKFVDRADLEIAELRRKHTEELQAAVVRAQQQPPPEPATCSIEASFAQFSTLVLGKLEELTSQITQSQRAQGGQPWRADIAGESDAAEVGRLREALAEAVRQAAAARESVDRQVREAVQKARQQAIAQLRGMTKGSDKQGLPLHPAGSHQRACFEQCGHDVDRFIAVNKRNLQRCGISLQSGDCHSTFPTEHPTDAPTCRRLCGVPTHASRDEQRECAVCTGNEIQVNDGRSRIDGVMLL